MDALYSFGFGHKFEDSDLFEHMKAIFPLRIISIVILEKPDGGL